MFSNYFLILFFGFLIGISLAFLLKKISLRQKFLTRNGVPLVGGISMWFGFLAACLLGFFLYGKSFPQVNGIIISSLIMFIFGVVDDRFELSIMAKFLAQIVVCAILIFFNVRTRIVYIPDIFNIIITFAWVLGITNAFNHLDVMDGVGGVTAGMVGLALFIISVLNGDIKSAILSLALTGAVLSFLIYNLPPAQIYMGNSGSHFLGFVLAAIALVISYAPLERKVALFSPLLILGFPIFDTAFLILARIGRSRHPFRKSNDHLALRFSALGYSNRQALLVMSVLCLFFTLCGIIVSQVSNRWGLAIVALVVLLSLFLAKKMGRASIGG